MPLTDELDFGNYKVLTVGGLSDKFSALGNGGSGMALRSTTYQQVTLALNRESDIVDFEFPHLYFGAIVEVNHLPSNTSHNVYQVNMVRNTNRFNIALMDYEGREETENQYSLKSSRLKMPSIPGKTSLQVRDRLHMRLIIQDRVTPLKC